MISVILVAEAKERELFGESFGEKSNFKIVFKTGEHSEALKAAEAYDKPVMLVRVEDPAGMKNFTEKLNEKKINYVALCSDAKDGFTMLAQGAADMLARDLKYFTSHPNQVESLLSIKIKSAHEKYFISDTRILKGNHGKFSKIIAIGSSTGGTEAVLSILQELPADSPPILIVQHMPPVFTRLYAERMHSICKMSVWEAQDGDELKRGLVLLAPGDFHLTLEKEGGRYHVRCKHGALVSGHCPSVDVLFRSVAKVAGSASVGVILTGMGRDGAEGLLEMRKVGAMTLGQDEESCVVYGMPKEAYTIGAVVRQLPLSEMAAAIKEYCKHKK